MPLIRLLVIDDDALDRKAVARAVGVLGTDYELQEAQEARAGIELAIAETFDCILVDYNLPDMNGLDVLAELRDRLGSAAPVIMLTGSGNEAVAVEAMKRGACDYLPKADLKPEALLRVFANTIEKCSLQKDLGEARDKLERLALYDTLTGLGNRNLFYVELARAVAISNRKQIPFILLMLDLDKFKTANDTFGHAAGDAILAAVGARLRTAARAADVFFRLGGDEFTAILDAGSDGGAAAKRIMRAIAEPIAFGGHELLVTVSIGLAIFPGDGGNDQDLVQAADAAMYAAKKSAQRCAWATGPSVPIRKVS